MKNKKIPYSRNSFKFQCRGKIDTPNAQIHDCTLSWLDTGTSIKSGVAKIIFLFLEDKYN